MDTQQERLVQNSLKAHPFACERLFCPGPTPVHPEVAELGNRQPIYHRSEEFYSIFSQTARKLGQLIKCRNNPIILSCSGTGGMEAALAGLVVEGDRVLTLRGGKFAERWHQLAVHLKADAQTFDFPWGTSPDLESLSTLLQEHSGLQAVLLQANETSTGVAYPLLEISRCIRKYSDALVVVDGISSIGAHHLDMDAWGVDVVVGGSQKGLGAPPGLAFVALSDRALTKLSGQRSFYFDLCNEYRLQRDGKSAWTPAVGLVVMLERALDRILAFGIANYVEHHRRLGVAVREAVSDSNLNLFAQSHYSNALTSLLLPPTIDADTLIAHLRKVYRATFAGGQDQLKGKIIRIAHLGTIDPLEVMSGLAVLECALADLGLGHDVGCMSRRFLRRYHQFNHLS